jgi:hypothetical protein
VICFLYLLRPIFESSLNTFLKKVMKIMMELFSGILYMPMVRTIVKYNYSLLSYQTCRMNVTSSIVPCIVQSPTLVLTVLSYSILSIFSLLLIFQTAVKY